MSDFEGLYEQAKANSGPQRRECAVGVFINNLPGEDADKVCNVLKDRSISAKALYDALKSRVGNDAPSAYTIGMHRRRDCGCFRELK